MRQHSVLCIDDNRATLATLAAVFQMHGHFAAFACTAEEAIQLAGGIRVDAVLLDCIIGGEGAAKRIAELQPAAAILLHTGNPDFWYSPPFPWTASYLSPQRPANC